MFKASASMTAGILVAASNSRVKFAVSFDRPSPGPMASTDLSSSSCARRPGARFESEMHPEPVASSGHVINSGAISDTTDMAFAGTAAVTRPAPTRIAASAVMAGAPALPPAGPKVPPTTSTWPKFPLLAVALRGECTSSIAEPAHSKLSSETIASSGEPMGATTTGWFQALVKRPNTCAGLGAEKVITASAGNTGSLRRAPVSSAGQPDGRSTARTGPFLALSHSCAARASPFNGGLNPVPTTASRIRSACKLASRCARSSSVATM